MTDAPRSFSGQRSASMAIAANRRSVDNCTSILLKPSSRVTVSILVMLTSPCDPRNMEKTTMQNEKCTDMTCSRYSSASEAVFP